MIITAAYTAWLRATLEHEVPLRQSTFIGALRGILLHTDGAESQVSAITELLRLYDDTGRHLNAELERKRSGVPRDRG